MELDLRYILEVFSTESQIHKERNHDDPNAGN